MTKKAAKYPPIRSFPVLEIERFVDGDTFVALIDVGFDLHMKVRARVNSINAPEMNTAEGPVSKEAAEVWADEAMNVHGLYFMCRGKDKYGRWLGDLVFANVVSSNEEDHHPLGSDLLSHYMLDSNKAVPYDDK